jgi:hypothetical protein
MKDDGVNILAKLDKMDERLDTVTITLVRNTEHLAEHMRRTAILEEDFKPVKAHVQLMNNVAKITSVVLAGVLAAKSLGVL